MWIGPRRRRRRRTPEATSRPAIARACAGGPSRRRSTWCVATSRARRCPRATASSDDVADDRGTVDEAEAKPLRLFVAVPIPETGGRRRRAQRSSRGGSALPGARWVPAENWHVTLQFLGSTSPSLLPVGAASGSPRWPPRGPAGSRPRLERARGVPLDAPRTRAVGRARRSSGTASPTLAGGARATRLRGEFEPEAGAFTPHLTVARSRSAARLPRGASRGRRSRASRSRSTRSC